MQTLKKLTLHNFHQSNSAKFAPFSGWEMPISYSSSIEEHKFVRQKAGLFDVSHMGELLISGTDSEKFLNSVLTNDLSKIVDGQAQYSLLCTEEGGTIDDLIIYKKSRQSFFLCVNASNIEKDFEHLSSIASGFNCEILNLSGAYGQLALQGPNALPIMIELLGEAIGEIKRMHFKQNEWLNGRESLIARSGYTGEDGFEIYCDQNDLWEWIELFSSKIDQQEIRLIGLAARDSLRLEAGFPLYGHELSDEISPLQAGLRWAVCFEKENFIGSNALEREQCDGLPGRVVHYEVDGRRIPRSEAIVTGISGNPIGKVLSGGFSPLLEKPIGTAWVEREALSEFRQTGGSVAMGRQEVKLLQTAPVLKRK